MGESPSILAAMNGDPRATSMSDQATIPIEPARAAGAEEGQKRPMSGVAGHTLIYGLGAVLGKGVGLLMLPVYTRYLTPADYGVMELIEMTLDVISIIGGAQLAMGIFRYYHKAKTQADRYAVVSTALIALGLSYFIVGMTSFLLAPWLSTLVFGSGVHTGLIRIASISLIFQSLLTVPLSFARVQDRSLLFVAANLLRMVVGLSLNVLFLVGMGMGVRGILLSGLIANLVVGTWLTVLVVREVGVRFSPHATRDLLRYGVPMMATQVATFFLTFGDRYFLQASSDTTVVGLYALAYQFAFLMAFFGAMPFMRVWDQKRFAVAERPDRDEIYARGFIYLNVLLLTMALGIGIFVQDLLYVMTTPAFHPAATLVPILLVAYVIQSWTSLQDIGILVRERTEFVTLGNWLAAGTALVAYAVLVPRYLGLGAAIATLIAFLVRHLIIVSISQWLWPVRYRWGPILRMGGMALFVFGLSALIPHTHILVSIAGRAVLMLGYLAVLWRMDVLSDDDRAAVRALASRAATQLRSAARRKAVGRA
jgi:O-antigen/teichoic acid export membrane protein